jgi:hypothetical protein
MGKRKYGARNEEFDLIQGLTIKEAAQMARENGGKIWEWAPEIVTAPGMVETGIDPYGPEFDTKEDLRRRLEESQARVTSERGYKEAAIKRHEDYQRQLIRGGLIPVELLGEFLVAWDIKAEHNDDTFRLSSMSITRAPEYTRTLTFRTPHAPHPAADAMDALLNHGRNKNS